MKAIGRGMRRWRRFRVRAGAAVFLGAAALLVACSGENLFTGPASGGTVAPSVNITAPLATFTAAVGDSVLVTVNLTSSEGVSTVRFNGVSAQGSFERFVEEIVTLPNPQDTTISNYLRATADSTVEPVDLIVEATSLLGGTAADTVTILVGS